MSFYINNTNGARPGPINGNPTNGICEKVLIETTKVFDACISQSTESGIVLILSNFNPANPVLPLTFISAEASTNEATVSDVVIDRIDSCPNFANVSATVTIPVVVTYRDANGVIGTATSSIVVQKNVILFVPQPAVAPITISASAVFSSEVGVFNPNDGTFTVTGCIQTVLKVIAPVDVLVPSYGYPFIPPCQTSPVASCPGTNVPLYPTATGSTSIPNV